MDKEKTAGKPLTQRLTDAYLLLMLTAFPLCFGPGGYLTISAVKFWVFAALTALYAAASAAALLAPGGRRAARRLTPVQWMVVLYWLLTLLSALLSPWRSGALMGMTRREGLVTITLYCAAFLLVSSFGRPAAWQLRVFGASMLAFCAVAFLQLAGKNPFGLYPAGTLYRDGDLAYAGRFLGTLGNVDLDAALLCLAVPALTLGGLRSADKKDRWLLLPAGCSLAVLLWMDVSAGVLGVFGGALLTLPLLPREKKARRFAAAGVGLTLLAALVLLRCVEGLPGMWGEAHELLCGRPQDSFGNGRLQIWRAVWQLVRERPLFGGGPDTLAARLTGVYRWNNPALGAVVEVSADVAHNEYLNILACQGVFALAAYLAALGFSAAAWLRGAGKPAAPVCGAAVLAYCIQALFGFSMCLTAPLFWLALALLNAPGQPAPEEKGGRLSGAARRRINQPHHT